MSLLVDNGSSLSFIKHSCLDRGTIISDSERHVIGGITNGKLLTLGTIVTQISFSNPNKLTETVKFHILPSNHFPYDGIVGRELLHLWDAVIYMRDQKLLLRKLNVILSLAPPYNDRSSQDETKGNVTVSQDQSSEEQIQENVTVSQKQLSEVATDPLTNANHNTIEQQQNQQIPEYSPIMQPINDNTLNEHLNEGNDQRNINKICLRPHCETLVEFTFPINEPLLCKQKFLNSEKTAYFQNCVIRPRENRAKVPIMNNTETVIEFNYISLPEYDLLSNYEVYSIQTMDFNNPVFESSIRGNVIFNLINFNRNLDPHHISQIHKLCDKYNSTFYLEGDRLSHIIAEEYEILTYPNADVINVKPYRVPFHQREEVRNQISQMLDSEVIRPSFSPYNSPLLVVPKKPDSTGKKRWRIVIDFRKLNEVIVKDQHPISNIDDIFDQLRNSRYFTTLDLANGYFQMRISQDSCHKTAFNALGSHFEFQRLPQGLCSAPAAFSRMIRNVLGDLLESHCMAYLDDIIIYSSTIEEHMEKLDAVFKRLSDHKIQVQPNKCEFMKMKLPFLGFIISSDGLCPDPKKTEAISNYPTPLNVKETKSFLGLASYYRRFIPNFSDIAYPLTTLTKKDEPFLWTSMCQDSFDNLKEKLCSQPILTFPDFNETFTLTTDASDYAIGAVLSQNDRVVSYGSRVLNKAERNYSTIEKEALAIYFFCKKYRAYLLGREFVIITDHKPLQWIYSIKDPSSRILRWRLALAEYSFKVEYKKGSLNSNADALSRIPIRDA